LARFFRSRARFHFASSLSKSAFETLSTFVRALLIRSASVLPGTWGAGSGLFIWHFYSGSASSRGASHRLIEAVILYQIKEYATCKAKPDRWLFRTRVTGISNGTEFHLLDSVDGTLGSGTRLFYEIEVNGQAPTSTPEPSTVIPAGAAFLAMGLFVAFRRKKAAALSN
jgi:hypothetical protein